MTWEGWGLGKDSVPGGAWGRRRSSSEPIPAPSAFCWPRAGQDSSCDDTTHMVIPEQANLMSHFRQDRKPQCCPTSNGMSGQPAPAGPANVECLLAGTYGAFILSPLPLATLGDYRSPSDAGTLPHFLGGCGDQPRRRQHAVLVAMNALLASKLRQTLLCSLMEAGALRTTNAGVQERSHRDGNEQLLTTYRARYRRCQVLHTVWMRDAHTKILGTVPEIDLLAQSTSKSP